ncbi:unnamed protein product [Linum tenue]|uniref:F-box domain-containing protein n=1 Tax=Linum tenue TaxID=586396 RepID=A0AAV0IRA7_9ROSI|nr:unnamed protein product [Linum tenue]
MGSKIADNPISKLGDDLLEEILIRLPNPKFSSRCRPVCKRWNSMISNPTFNRRFVSHHRSKNETGGEPPLLFPSDDHPLSSILSFLPVPGEIRSKFRVWDSFKDLVLCGFNGRQWDTDPELGRLFLICNPFTKQWVALPLALETKSRSCETTEAKLVCQEAPKANSTLDLGDGQVFVYSDYQFRVLVRHSEMGYCSELQVFCSESCKWSRRKDPCPHSHTVSLNGKEYWIIRKTNEATLVRFDPFRLNVCQTTVDDDIYFFRRAGGGLLDHFSTSRGALYVSTCNYPNVLTIRRWEEGSWTWTTCYETRLETLKRNSGPEVGGLKVASLLAQHPEKPEVLFLQCHCDKIMTSVYSCNLRTEKLELVADQMTYGAFGRWKVFQPRTICFSTPIPSYQNLLGMYSGSYNDLVQSRKSI